MTNRKVSYAAGLPSLNGQNIAGHNLKTTWCLIPSRTTFSFISTERERECHIFS